MIHRAQLRSLPLRTRLWLARRAPALASSDGVERLVLVADQDADLIGGPVESSASMLSRAERAVLYQLVRHALPIRPRIAELGCYIGGTTELFGEAMRRNGVTDARLEVYDFFEHNAASRRRLRSDPDWNATDFYDIWHRTTEPYRDLIDLHRGDLRTTASDRTAPLDLLYVDTVKHQSLISPVMQSFVPRLRTGRFLVHQDYFHWQSPWVVYATERIMSSLRILGSVSNHTLVLRLDRRPSSKDLAIDDVADLSRDEKIGLMRRAIDRQHGVRRGLLRVSLVHLAGGWETFDLEREVDQIRADTPARHGSCGTWTQRSHAGTRMPPRAGCGEGSRRCRPAKGARSSRQPTAQSSPASFVIRSMSSTSGPRTSEFHQLGATGEQRTMTWGATIGKVSAAVLGSVSTIPPGAS